MGEMAMAPELSESAWRDTLDTNLTSAFLGAKYQLPAMLKRGSGSLIFTSSFVGYTAGMPGMAAYAASKAGLIGLAQCLAVEVGSENIRVNALLPGGTRTRMHSDNFKSEEEIAFVNNIHGLKRIAEPEEIGKAAVFLASDASSFVTGSAMLVDGGVSITRT
jgi:NAD(P)-dependent dehydrogenase (short-subunit alcohol dehydrogenase family)